MAGVARALKVARHAVPLMCAIVDSRPAAAADSWRRYLNT